MQKWTRDHANFTLKRFEPGHCISACLSRNFIDLHFDLHKRRKYQNFHMNLIILVLSDVF